MKKKEYSKILTRDIKILVVIVVIYSLVAMWKTDDFTSLPNLMDNVFQLAGIVTAFYFGKAAIENRVKLKKLFKVPLDEEDFR